VLVFSWHSLVTQAHFHGRAALKPLAGTQAAGTALLREASRGERSDPSTECPLCQDAAAAGHYITPTSATVAPLLRVVFQPAEQRVPSDAPQQRSHLWQSRAPPLPAQA